WVSRISNRDKLRERPARISRTAACDLSHRTAHDFRRHRLDVRRRHAARTDDRRLVAGPPSPSCPLLSPLSRWQAAALRVADRMRVTRPFRVVESRLVDVPTVIGWMRPAIVLPLAAIANLSPAQVESILAHELAHIRRHDYAVNLLQTLAE